jgi:probable HAF family extracellular repeat protein
VGWARTKDGKYHAALFDPSGSGTNVDLRTLAGHDMSWAYSINNMGQAVGRSRDTTQQGGRAVLFDLTGSGNNIDLGTLGGPYSWARSINDAGEIVGGANTASGDGHATLFDPTGNASNIDLGTLGGNGSAAYSINDNRQIVGYALTDLGTWYATLFDSKGGGNNVNLNNCIDPAMGWTLTRAYSINNKGWIVGYGLNSEGYEHAFLLKPIPLPGALILGSIGIGLAGWLHRRRKL